MVVAIFASIALALPAASAVNSLEQTSAFEETDLATRGRPYKLECTLNWYYKKSAAECFGSMAPLVFRAPVHNYHLANFKAPLLANS